MLRSKDSLPAHGSTRSALRSHAFTLLEVALVVAIIGMMLLMIVGYLFAPNQPDKLPPVGPPTLIPPSTGEPAPTPKKAAPIPPHATPSATVTTPEPAAAAAPASAPAAPATPAATPVPVQTIDLSPQSTPIFR